MMFVADRTASKYSPSVANLILTFSSGCEFICKGGGEMMSAAGSGRESACARVCVRVRVCLFICVSVHFCVCLRVSVCVCACLHTRKRASLGSSTCPPPPFPFVAIRIRSAACSFESARQSRSGCRIGSRHPGARECCSLRRAAPSCGIGPAAPLPAPQHSTPKFPSGQCARGTSSARRATAQSQTGSTPVAVGRGEKRGRRRKCR